MLPSIALPYKQMSTTQQVDFAKNLVDKMTTDARFQSLKATVDELATKLNEWQLAIEKAQTGGKIKMIKKIEKGLTVRDKVFYLAEKVEIMAEEDNAIIAAAGYENERKIALTNNAFTSAQLEELLITVA